MVSVLDPGSGEVPSGEAGEVFACSLNQGVGPWLVRAGKMRSDGYPFVDLEIESKSASQTLRFDLGKRRFVDLLPAPLEQSRDRLIAMGTQVGGDLLELIRAAQVDRRLRQGSIDAAESSPPRTSDVLDLRTKKPRRRVRD